MKFSPDEHYFVAGHLDSFEAYDLKERAEAKGISWRLRDLGRLSFTFVAPDELAGLHYAGANDMKLVRLSFPAERNWTNSGPGGWMLSSSGNRDALLMRPAAAYPVAIVDLKARKITQAFKSPAFAVYGQMFAGEQAAERWVCSTQRTEKCWASLLCRKACWARPKPQYFPSMANGSPSPRAPRIAVESGQRSPRVSGPWF